ncbi:MAG: ribosome-associated translation inhibitor RaiA [Eubacteriales bacterium]
MRIIINSKGMEVSDYLSNTINKKVKRLDRYFPKEAEAHVTMSIQRSRHIVEITITYGGLVLRGEEVTGDMYASIDGALKKMERQIIKHRTKLEKRYQSGSLKNIEPIFSNEEIKEDDLQVVKTKTFPSKPMSLDEAIMQMEMLGHQFFAFVSDDTQDVNVLYLRKDGNLGLLKPSKV